MNHLLSVSVLVDNIEEAAGKQAHKVIPMIASKKIADNINKWKHGQDALNGVNKDAIDSANRVSRSEKKKCPQRST